MNPFEPVTQAVGRGRDKVTSFIGRRKYLSIAFEVHKRFDEDKGNNKVGFITYYMFLSIWPLLIATLTIFDIIFKNSPDLQERLIDSTLATIPVIGPTLESDLSFVKAQGLTLLVTLIILLWSAKGGSLAIQDALTSILHRKKTTHSFISKQFRAYIALGVICIGIIVPTAASSYFHDSMSMQATILFLSIGWNSMMLYLIFALLVKREYAMGPGIFIGGLGITIIQFLSVYIVSRTLENARPLYGTLAVVFAMFVWISLQVRVLLYSAEINAYIKSMQAKESS
jgi:membrane protein